MSATTWTRANALLSMTSPLGDDQLIPISLSAHEAIGEPFFFDILAVCQMGLIDPNQLLNNPACVTLRNAGGDVRYFHGIVQQVRAMNDVRGASGVTYRTYQIVLVPRLWFLGQTVDCRVYQNKAADDILKAMFSDAGLTDYTVQPSGSTREYTVQFNESDLHFATRLMEEEGWFYFFQHSSTSHQLIVANQNTAFPDLSATLNLRGADEDHQITGWTAPTGTTRGQMTLKDYDPVNPGTLLQDQEPTTLQTAGATQRDDFRWPALTFDSGTVTNRTKWEMEAAEAGVSLFEGNSRYGPLVAGGKFTIASTPSNSYDGTYVLRSVNHEASDDTWLNQSGTSSYANRLAAFPVAVNWRQPMVTPRPRMDGIHLALVLGPDTAAGSAPQLQSGEEIYTDDLARVKVRFFWDHRGEATGSLAVWARVIQLWAGNGWGTQFIPRVGTEVAVAFVDGDPDRPIVVGGLYNGAQSPIYSKSDKTKSGFRTRSSLSGGTSDFNELTFDDNAGSELIYLQAQKDMNALVKNNETLTVNNCRIVNVKQDETITITNNQTLNVQNQQTITVSSGRQVTISSGGDQLTVSSGDYTINVNSGQISATASKSIGLTVGSNSLTINQQGVSISAGMINIAGNMSVDLKAPKGSFNADAQLTLKGGVMMLN